MTATSGAKALPTHPSEEHLRKEAKRLARASGAPVSQAQRRLAHDYGFASWPQLVRHVREAAAAPPLTPLLAAIDAGDLGELARRIAAGDPLDAAREGEGSPLWRACASDHPAATRIAIFERLIAAGANPRSGTPAGRVPLHAAAARGPWALVERLIALGALHWQDDSRGRTALDYARAGDAPDKDVILRRLTRPVIEDADFAAAVAAIHAGDLTALRRVLDASPDLVRRRAVEPACYPQDYFRDPKLIWFVAGNPDAMAEVPASMPDLAREIAGRGVAHDDLDYTLELAMTSTPTPWRGRQAAMLETLLDLGAKPTRMAILMTLGHGLREPVRLLLRRGAPLTAPIAAALGDTAALPALLAAASAEDRHAALSMAVINGEHEAARLALAAGADPNARSAVHRHAMPVHNAVHADDVAMLALLVEAGARLDVTDTNWRSTPAGWARFLNKPKCLAFLDQRAATAAPA